MPSADVVTRLRDRLFTQRNLTISTAIVVGLLVTYGFSVAFDPDGSFLLLLTVGVVVPTLYDEYQPPYNRAWKAIGWIVCASVIASAAFVSLHWVGTELVGLTPLRASVGAFLVTTIGGIAVLGR